MLSKVHHLNPSVTSVSSRYFGKIWNLPKRLYSISVHVLFCFRNVYVIVYVCTMEGPSYRSVGVVEGFVLNSLRKALFGRQALSLHLALAPLTLLNVVLRKCDFNSENIKITSHRDPHHCLQQKGCCCHTLTLSFLLFYVNN